MKKIDMKEYWVYHNIKQRCNNPNHSGYSYYGKRGIKFKYDTFEDFFEDLGSRPSDRHSVDRIDNNGNYEKGNCRWATMDIQCNNRRIRKTNKSGYAGISWYKQLNKWRVRVGKNRKGHYWDTLEEAIKEWHSLRKN